MNSQNDEKPCRKMKESGLPTGCRIDNGQYQQANNIKPRA